MENGEWKGAFPSENAHICFACVCVCLYVCVSVCVCMCLCVSVSVCMSSANVRGGICKVFQVLIPFHRIRKKL
jgi:hypothetical protein